MKINPIFKRSFFVFAVSAFVVSCNGKKEGADDATAEETTEVATDSLSLLLNRLNLPEGFSISVYAKDLEGARSMAMGADGTLFVGTRNEGKVYAVKDTDGDYKVDETYTIATDLEQPNGVAFKDGAL